MNNSDEKSAFLGTLESVLLVRFIQAFISNFHFAFISNCIKEFILVTKVYILEVVLSFLELLKFFNFIEILVTIIVILLTVEIS